MSVKTLLATWDWNHLILRYYKFVAMWCDYLSSIDKLYASCSGWMQFEQAACQILPNLICIFSGKFLFTLWALVEKHTLYLIKKAIWNGFRLYIIQKTTCIGKVYLPFYLGNLYLEIILKYPMIEWIENLKPPPPPFSFEFNEQNIKKDLNSWFMLYKCFLLLITTDTSQKFEFI